MIFNDNHLFLIVNSRCYTLNFILFWIFTNPVVFKKVYSVKIKNIYFEYFGNDFFIIYL